MPEEPEIDTERARESIVERLEHGGSDRLLRTIALTTAVLAACAAIAALQSGATVNHALILKTEATRLQAEASDQWAYYQAKGIKAAIQDASRVAWLAAGKPVPPAHEAEMVRYAAQQEEIKKLAEAKERERDAASRDADHLLRRHHGFANAVALIHDAYRLAGRV